MAETKIEWVGTDQCGQLIDEAFVGESVLHATRRPDQDQRNGSSARRCAKVLMFGKL